MFPGRSVRSRDRLSVTVSSRDDNGWTALHKASIYGHLHVAKFLLECGVAVDIRNGGGKTSIDLASGCGKLDVVRFLIKHGGDVNVKDSKGWYPLHIASANRHRARGMLKSDVSFFFFFLDSINVHFRACCPM